MSDDRGRDRLVEVFTEGNAGVTPDIPPSHEGPDGSAIGRGRAG